ncbi:hypothetical protein HDU81_003427 [Chytriomyces hyalinus]|nr:hypothetical protein HDU81_003427 [Chytriomyces hyalinus]
MRGVLVLAVFLVGSAVYLTQMGNSHKARAVSPSQHDPKIIGPHLDVRISRPSRNESSFSFDKLMELCHNGDSLTVTKFYTLGGDAQEDHYLSNCHPIEISTDQKSRSRGHCSDFVQYIYYGDARLTPYFSDETYKRKMERCPYSFYLHGEYPIVTLFNHTMRRHIRDSDPATITTPKAPRRVRNIWMPNWEQIKKEQSWLIRASHMIACKVHAMCSSMEKYLADKETQKRHLASKNDNERLYANATPILRFMSHSSPDASSIAVGASKPDRFNKFYHAFGQSGRKNTPAVVECWLNHSNWPNLTVIGDHAVESYSARILATNATNIQVFDRLPTEKLQELQASHGVHLCPSNQEGYGHYINEARTLGAVVVTTHHPPMDEFVTDGVSGVLIDHKGAAPEDYQLLIKYATVAVSVSWENICDGVERVTKMSLDARAEMGVRARQRYVQDTALMAKNIKILKREAEVYNGGAFDGFKFLKRWDNLDRLLF